MRSFLGGVLGKVPRPSPAMVVALLALLIACSGAAVAAIPGQDGTITACRNEHNGALRVIDAQEGQTCRASEAQLSWKAGSGPGTDLGDDLCQLGEIQLFATQKIGFTWEMAEGQLLPISQYEALYSLIGTTFGGDGTSTFALPDLTANAPENTYYAICVEGYYPEEPSQ
jgi:hypothetical protein